MKNKERLFWLAISCSLFLSAAFLVSGAYAVEYVNVGYISASPAQLIFDTMTSDEGAEANVILYSLSDKSVPVSLSVQGVPATWISFEPEEVWVNKSQPATIKVIIKPDGTATAGEYTGHIVLSAPFASQDLTTSRMISALVGLNVDVIVKTNTNATTSEKEPNPNVSLLMGPVVLAALLVLTIVILKARAIKKNDFGVVS